jgi:hypothetical protein
MFQVMPPLSPDEFSELKSDIQARGVMVPIEYDETGNILDGHHRVKACGTRQAGVYVLTTEAFIAIFLAGFATGIWFTQILLLIMDRWE